MSCRALSCTPLAALAPCIATAIGAPSLSFQTIPIPSPLSHMDAAGISADGNTVCGGGVSSLGIDYAVRWTRSGGSHTLITENGFLNCIGTGISADGATIVGWAFPNNVNGTRAIYWNPAPHVPYPDHGFNGMTCASADGSVLAGFYGGDAMRWTAAGGVEVLPSFAFGNARATGMSWDGKTIVGYDTTGVSWVWHQSTGSQRLAFMAGDQRPTVEAVSGDGKVAVGVADDPSDNTHHAFRWTESAGYTDLGSLDPTVYYSRALATNADGSVIVGTSRRSNDYDYPFIWTEATGMLDLQSILISAGLPADAWQWMKPTGVSADGLTIVGSGTLLGVGSRAWIATIPGPPGVGVLAGMLVLASRRRR